ncbi:MAG: type VI secretion system baseplate subunit TssE [Planctomycetes bacterium]|nr:type VI secretion system baseplate subunit TssE [Planctomycetota bacterium]
MSATPTLRPSIVDRLCDPESRGTVAQPGYTIEQMARAIEADLDRLLNTRSNDTSKAKQYRLLYNVMGYGLPDLAELSRLVEKDPENICRAIEEKIARYEPRLRDVKVIIGEGDGNRLKIHLRLRAVLAVDPAPEIAFEKTFDMSSGQFEDLDSQ